MGRPCRTEYQGGIYHVIVQGNNNEEYALQKPGLRKSYHNSICPSKGIKSGLICRLLAVNICICLWIFSCKIA